MCKGNTGRLVICRGVGGIRVEKMGDGNRIEELERVILGYAYLNSSDFYNHVNIALLEKKILIKEDERNPKMEYNVLQMKYIPTLEERKGKTNPRNFEKWYYYYIL